MPDITYSYVPITGSVLTSAGLNANFYQTTAGTSIHETSNGHREMLNFDPAFRVQSYHVRPGQAGQANSVGRTQSNDYFSDLSTGLSNEYTPIAGCGITFYTDYDISMAMFFASGFCTIWRQFGPYSSAAWANRVVAPDISIRTFFASPNGGIRTHEHSQRDMPQTVFINPASPVGPPHVGRISTVEQRLTRHFNLSHPKMVGGVSPCDQLLAGEHTFGLAVLVKKNLAGQDTSSDEEAWRLRLNGAGSSDARPSTNFSGIQRVRFYVRNASAIRLL